MRVLITGAGEFIGGHIAARDRQGGIVAAAVPNLASPSLSYDAGARGAASRGSSFLEGDR
jgi:nucleoside-diphosphate-sugar epimerase